MWPRATEPLARSAFQMAGPDDLGRSLVVGPDDEIPSPWRGCDRIAVSGDEAKPEVIDRLRQAWQQRERLVIQWSGPPPDPDPILDLAFNELGPDLAVPGDDLAFFVTANAVWAVDGVVGFEPINLAVGLGAVPIDGDGPGDVVDRSNRRLWVDGGPLDLALSPAGDDTEDTADPAETGDPENSSDLVPRVQLMAGSLAPLRLDTECEADLAPDQMAAVSHRSGPARILAPAGSGKTRVLTERTRHLVTDRGLSAAAVSLVAYNRRARQEMKDRLADVDRLDVRTLNSLALAIATGSGPFVADGRSPAVTIDERDARRLLADLIPGRRRQRLTDPLEAWIDALSACRLGLRDPEEVEAAYGGDITGFPRVLEQYRRTLADRNQMDFDEQILTAITRLLTEPAARRAARRAVPVLLVDEFQDLTPAHLLLVRLLAGPAREVFAVGDDDQTIYGYAGASPRWLVDFDQFFPLAGDHRLEVNYRCPPGVVEAATNLLTHNRFRVPKSIRSGRPEPGDQPIPPNRTIEPVSTTGNPQAALVDRVSELVEAGVEPGDVAVLSRVNAALLPAAVHLELAGIPVARPPGMDERMLDRSGMAAALAWLRLATAPAQGFGEDDLALALRRPPRSLHPRVADWTCEQESIPRLRALAGRLNTERESVTVNEFADDLERVRSQAERGTTEAVLELVMNGIGLLGAATQLDSSQRTARRAAHTDDLSALLALAPLEPRVAEFEPWLRAVLARDPSAGEFDGATTGVTLATVHTTKGLEWPHVVVHDVRGGLFPHRLADDIEEERRVFHVAITRGRRSVTITRSGPPSPFVAELAESRGDDEPWPSTHGDTGGPLSNSTSRPSGRAATAKAGGRSNRAEDNPTSSPAEAARREALTEWRRARCREDNVPAYVVLDNKTLFAIAATNPTDLGGLGSISGIGPTKLDRYGPDILGVLASTDDG